MTRLEEEEIPPRSYLHLVESTLLLGERMCAPMHQAMQAAAQLLVGPPIPDRFRGRCQTKRDTLVLQAGGWAWGWRPHPVKICCHGTSHRICEAARVLQEL
jgi:hypothetical protein